MQGWLWPVYQTWPDTNKGEPTMPTLDEVIDQARRLAEHDKSLAYHYLMAILTGGQEPETTKAPQPARGRSGGVRR